LNNSKEIPRKQTTSREDYFQDVRLEAGDNGKVPSILSAFDNRRNSENVYANNLMEKILAKDNMNQAYKRVVRNKGKHGIDGMTVDELLPYLRENGKQLRKDILQGKYKPKSVRRAEIAKPDRGVRLLGIPTVIDRMIQQAIAQQLTPIFELKFSDNSYGFRPNRNAHQAIRKARQYINEGYTWVVDIDLEKYFDTVNHDKLMSLVAREVKDKRVLKLIRAYLNSGVMINGVVVETDKGCPQGGPLNPLLSNIMLNELDKELEERNHKFCRYADDNQLYVKTRKAAERVMSSITKFIEDKLKVKVNKKKSAIGRPWERKFLGFSFYTKQKELRIRVHPKSIKRVKEKIRFITSRSNAWSMEFRYLKLRQLIIGWVSYFRLADIKTKCIELDEWTRRRIRMCYWKQWKKIKTKHDNLRKLGIDNFKAWEYANTRKGYWKISNSPILTLTFTNKRLKNSGYLSFTERYTQVTNF
jgi:group II intron reverse transcriptase/maturase